MSRINLAELTEGRVHNLSGHERGVAARERFRLAELDEANEVVVIDVPDSLYTLTPSFFQGMFAQSVAKFGDREGFLLHYKFDADNVILQQIDNGIRSSLMKRKSIFDGH